MTSHRYALTNPQPDHNLWHGTIESDGLISEQPAPFIIIQHDWESKNKKQSHQAASQLMSIWYKYWYSEHTNIECVSQLCNRNETVHKLGETTEESQNIHVGVLIRHCAHINQ